MARRYPLGAVCFFYLVLLVAAVVAAPLLAPYNPKALDLAKVLALPGGDHWLGTDQLGRDVLSRLLFGGRDALMDVVTAVVTSLVIGVPLGLLAGYVGGWVDRAIMWIADLVMAVPHIVVLLMVVAIFPANNVIAMVTLGLMHTPALARIIRGSTIACRNELFVRAAELSGLRTAAILRRHLLPSLTGPVIVQASLFFATALVIESGLSFLGLLRPDSAGPTWGNMVTQAAHVSGQDPWLLVPTGGIVALTVIACSLLGDAVRDATVGRSVPPVALRSNPKRRPADDIPSSPGAGVLEVRGLSVTLDRGGVDTTVVSDVSFTLNAGECIGIVGESGCGKSTTIKAILGLLPVGGQVTSGAVRFEDTDLTRLTEKELCRLRGVGIALVSQDPLNSLDPVYTVGSQLREVIRRHSRMTRAHADERALELLRMVRFPDPAAVLRQRAHELSGGMAQRVGIALALAAGPKVLIADEPTSALDVTVQAEVLALLRDLREQLGMAVILVTHDWGVVADICDRTLVMYAGEVVEAGPIDQVYNRPAHPYSDALLASYPGLAVAGEPLPTIEGQVPQPGSWPSGCHFAARCSLAGDDCRATEVELVPVAHDHAARCLHTDELMEVR
ncbi:MAG TPA: dipeptide/oligopeptide/nickel ABC transporter permease/ATP-binding protein [Kribbella sp.]